MWIRLLIAPTLFYLRKIEKFLDGVDEFEGKSAGFDDGFIIWRSFQRYYRIKLFNNQ